MHDTFESFIKAFDEIRALLVNKDDMISRYNRVNINALKEIQIFLSVFKKISVEIEGDQYVTRVHILPAMDIINEHIKINPTDSLIVQNMKKRAATYIAENKNEVLPLNHEIWPFFHPDFKRMEGFKSVDKVVVMNTIELAIQSMSNDGTINSVNIDTASNRSSSTCSGNIPVNSIFTSLKDNVESTEGFSDEIIDTLIVNMALLAICLNGGKVTKMSIQHYTDIFYNLRLSRLLQPLLNVFSAGLEI